MLHHKYITVFGFLLLMVAAGCTSSKSSMMPEFDSATNVRSMSSKRTVMGYRDMSGGLAANQRVMWQAEAECEGEGCVPAEVEVAFFNDTSRGLNMDYRRVEFVIDGRSHSWKAPGAQDDVAYRVPAGEFWRIPLQSDLFVALATAKKVEILFGQSGTSKFAVSTSRRAAFKDFAESFGLIQ